MQIVRRIVKRCPSCGSTGLYYEAGMITGQKYHCRKCNYIGPLVFEEEVEERLKPGDSGKHGSGFP
ncbi:MAG: hypothetical protein KIY12_05275 [Thermoplasmata archaeon]|uniref:Transposase n=1 Tax=Candidatus Sysuiplasma superficiale TaxID=2823368 RepID=A0A8J7YNR7_9ARCH|nr:hypothetical protein [Candidatus Sysuiplasma superficiale]MBX8644120.1 hypothetical protein [Candidatus Sysuiplasma superficiale]MCL4346479.1 hypothetical protein [Candidatus Thermoplasmatota archaeon]